MFGTEWLGLQMRGGSDVSDEEKSVRIARVVSSFEQHVEIKEAETALKRGEWDVEKAKEELSMLHGAREGLLIPLSLRTVDFRGAENSGNSCYLDALLIGMFATTDKYDFLITGKRHMNLTSLLRVFVNNIRMGKLVPKDTVDAILEELTLLGWRSCDGQEDASELFMFLMNVLEAPPLSSAEQLHHGAIWEENVDNKIVYDHCLMFGIPNGEEPLHLLEIVQLNMNETVVEDLSREVDESGRRRAVLVNALKTVSVDEENLTLLPILLKRAGSAKRPVQIPLEVDLGTYSGSQNSRHLRLVSAVCHLGEVNSSGHYVTYLFDENGSCSRWDDLQGITESSIESEELRTCSYMLFYS